MGRFYNRVSDGLYLKLLLFIQRLRQVSVRPLNLSFYRLTFPAKLKTKKNLPVSFSCFGETDKYHAGAPRHHHYHDRTCVSIEEQYHQHRTDRPFFFACFFRLLLPSSPAHYCAYLGFLQEIDIWDEEFFCFQKLPWELFFPLRFLLGLLHLPEVSLCFSFLFLFYFFFTYVFFSTCLFSRASTCAKISETMCIDVGITIGVKRSLFHTSVKRHRAN